ncbi:MAG: SEC-C domain-containing protein [Bacillota bacterium]
MTPWDFRGVEHGVAFDLVDLLSQLASECGPRRYASVRASDLGWPLASAPRLRVPPGRRRRLPARWLLRRIARVMGLECRARDSASWRTPADFVRWAAARLDPVPQDLGDEPCWCGSGRPLGSCCAVRYRPRRVLARMPAGRRRTAVSTPARAD